MADTYPPVQQRSDASSLGAQLRTFAESAKTILDLIDRLERGGQLDLLYLEEKALRASRAALAIANDSRLIFERQGTDRWYAGLPDPIIAEVRS